MMRFSAPARGFLRAGPIIAAMAAPGSAQQFRGTPAWPPTLGAPETAPNVLVMLTDDVGFGAPARCSAPPTLNRAYRATAEIEVPAGGADGVLAAQGGRFGGYGFYRRERRTLWTWN